MAALSLDRVSKAFGETTALAEVSIAVGGGELLSVVGPSGCGKTTLLRIIAGLTQADSGKVLLDGRDLSSVPPHARGIGVVFQHYALWPHMTVERNVAFGLEMHRLPRAERAGRIRETLELMRIGELAGRLPHELSGGQQQRVALARALALRPAVLLMDEPLANLDRRLRTGLREVIHAVQRELELTTIIVTHDQEEALALADRVALLEAGRLIQLGNPRELYFRPRTISVADFLGAANHLHGRIAGGVLETELGKVSGIGGADRDVTVVIRPEHLTLERAAGGASPGTIESVRFLGPLEEITVLSARGTRLVSRAPSGGRTIISAGDAVSIHADPSNLVIIEER